MPERTLDAEIDRLYQLPLEEFTTARNALAKQAGPAGAKIRALTKPPAAAWAVNQVHWRDRSTYDALMKAAAAQRSAHAAVLAGKRADLRSVGREHEQAIEAALKSALAWLSDAGHPATDATKQAIATTLRGLPADTAPGRLDRTLQPGGFEMLAGVPVRDRPAPRVPRVENAKRKPAATTPRAQAKPEKPAKPTPAQLKAIERAKEAVTGTARALRAAEHAAKREEFEAARAARDVEKAERSLAGAREAFKAAQEAVEEAESDVAKAEQARDTADRRARNTDAALERARSESDAAQRDLERHTR
jgi:hypothetical protein